MHIAMAIAHGATLFTLDRRMAAAASALRLQFLLL